MAGACGIDIGDGDGAHFLRGRKELFAIQARAAALVGGFHKASGAGEIRAANQDVL